MCGAAALVMSSQGPGWLLKEGRSDGWIKIITNPGYRFQGGPGVSLVGWARSYPGALSQNPPTRAT